MQAEEHYYSDDPKVGHPDVKTNLGGVNYYFIGNGLIQAALQVCKSGEGSPVGLILMHPEKLGFKRDTLTMDPISGLEDTKAVILKDGKEFAPTTGGVNAKWSHKESGPEVHLRWTDGPYEVEELFYCLNEKSPLIIREIKVFLSSKGGDKVEVRTGVKGVFIKKKLSLKTPETASVIITYELIKDKIDVKWNDQRDVVQSWNRNLTSCEFHNKKLDHMFFASKSQIPAVISRSGRMDGSIWQYNLEWVRDQSMAIQALIVTGHFELAKTMITRLFRDFVTRDGDTVDSSQSRPIEEIELDQNGQLLILLKSYVDWTGDLDLLKTLWQKVKAVANFPLKREFRHQPSGLLCNSREFWERHAAYGVKPGMELTYQAYVILGLSCASDLAKRIKKEQESSYWKEEAQRIKNAMLSHNKYSLVENNTLIKRRALDGSVQETLKPPKQLPLFKETALDGPGPHYFNPDTSSVLPIVMGIVAPKGEVAKNTLESMELLWNQCWEGGGYGRYHVSSEPDSPGPWPFASLFVARAYFETGDDEKVWRVLNWLSEAPGAESGAWFEFYGPRNSPPSPQVGVIPWVWAEIILLLIYHLFGVRPGNNAVQFKPRLLNGMDRVSGNFRYKKNRIKMTVRRAKEGERPGFYIQKEFIPYSSSGVRIVHGEGNIDFKALLPGGVH